MPMIVKLGEGSNAPSGRAKDAPPSGPAGEEREPSRKLAAALLVALVVVAGGLALYFTLPRPEGAASSAASPPAVAATPAIAPGGGAVAGGGRVAPNGDLVDANGEVMEDLSHERRGDRTVGSVPQESASPAQIPDVRGPDGEVIEDNSAPTR